MSIYINKVYLDKMKIFRGSNVPVVWRHPFYLGLVRNLEHAEVLNMMNDNTSNHKSGMFQPKSSVKSN